MVGRDPGACGARCHADPFPLWAPGSGHARATRPASLSRAAAIMKSPGTEDRGSAFRCLHVPGVDLHKRSRAQHETASRWPLGQRCAPIMGQLCPLGLANSKELSDLPHSFARPAHRPTGPLSFQRERRVRSMNFETQNAYEYRNTESPRTGGRRQTCAGVRHTCTRSDCDNVPQSSRARADR
ncbi:hypothetical protein FA95DRAFT_897506 [Auriscalpium vulgare]|uniref:Uncharacterized protein n=1 Tax=Auriscalpium vulgare TaxID=40419 RepID=A0ACB8S046_9AGAM|nr:hypothetical protein FA95DRAFT_897506 [Auriscalpium vulgare]